MGAGGGVSYNISHILPVIMNRLAQACVIKISKEQTLSHSRIPVKDKSSFLMKYGRPKYNPQALSHFSVLKPR